MSKPAAFIMVEGGRTWLRASAETEEAIRTGFIMESVPLYTTPPKREPLSDDVIADLWGDKYAGKTFMVRNFARAIEKAHGITGGGE
jgi:hypothetical protein